MDERPASAAAALEIMQQWQWLRGDPDGNVWPNLLEVNNAANRLAMEGILRPQDALLSLLCRGDLLAWGDFRWRKYQNGSHFQLEENDVPIKPKQWQELADLIEAERLDIEDGGFGFFPCELPKLGMQNCHQHDWAFFDNRFSTARCHGDKSSLPMNYLEEWFSAWNIEVRPSSLDNDFQSVDPEPIAPTSKPMTNKGGRPPAADWELAALEIAGRYYRGDFKPQTIADVGRALAGWLGDQDLHLSDSIVRTHAKRIFEAFQAWDGD